MLLSASWILVMELVEIRRQIVDVTLFHHWTSFETSRELQRIDE